MGRARSRAGLAIRSIPVHVPARPRDYPPPASHVPFVVGEIVLLAAMAALAVLVRMHVGPLPGDAELERSWQQLILPHRSLTDALEAASTVNWPVPAAITLGVVGLIFLVLQRWLDILVVVACSIVSDEAAFAVSQFIHRPRPSDHHLFILKVIRQTYSFPSIHVVHATAVFGLLLFLSFQVRRSLPGWMMWIIRAALLGFILVMGPSRMLEGQHWPSDVAAGYIWGLFWLVIFAHVYAWARHRFPRLLARDER